MAKRPQRQATTPPPVAPPTDNPNVTEGDRLLGLTAEQRKEYDDLIGMGMSEDDAYEYVAGQAPNPVENGKAKATVTDTTAQPTAPAAGNKQKPHEGKNAPKAASEAPKAVARTPMAGKYPQDMANDPDANSIDKVNS